MPVKRRVTKRAINPEREYTIWSALFLTGAEIFPGEMVELGFPPDKQSVTPDEARDAWRRFGARHIAEHPRSGPCWAERELGTPGAVQGPGPLKAEGGG